MILTACFGDDAVPPSCGACDPTIDASSAAVRRPQDDAICMRFDPASLGYELPVPGLFCVSIHIVGGGGVICCRPPVR